MSLGAAGLPMPGIVTVLVLVLVFAHTLRLHCILPRLSHCFASPVSYGGLAADARRGGPTFGAVGRRCTARLFWMPRLPPVFAALNALSTREAFDAVGGFGAFGGFGGFGGLCGLGGFGFFPCFAALTPLGGPVCVGDVGRITRTPSFSTRYTSTRGASR